MDINVLKQGLLITGIGMGLVFVMIFLLWGIMALLVWITNPRQKKAEESEIFEEVGGDPSLMDVDPVLLDTPVPAMDDEDELQRLAVAMAVAFAIKRPRPQKLATAPQLDQSSGWLSVGRAQQLLSRNRGRN